MNDSQISTAINNLRAEAGLDLDADLLVAGPVVCPTCRRPAHSPARRVVAGEVVEGCVDAFHHGHLAGDDLAWHDRPYAQQLRARTLAAMPEPESITECLRLMGM